MADNNEFLRREAIMAEFLAAAKGHGLIIDGMPEADGEFHRVAVEGDKAGQKSGSYKLSLDGVPGGYLQNYKLGENAGLPWLPSRNSAVSVSLTPEQRAESARRKAEQAQARHETQLERAEWSSREWATLRPAPDDHAYLLRKGVINHGLKIDTHGNLVMPLRDIAGKMWSVQRISPDGEKLFTKNARTEACFSYVGQDDPSKPVVIAEGYATAASVYEITALPVVTALNAGNLLPVAKALRERYPDRPILFAGDNDHMKEAAGKPNVGKEAAIAAAAAVGGHVVLPVFAAGDAGTDWNDLAASRGPAIVRSQIEAVTQPLGIFLGAPLGIDARTYLDVPYKEREAAQELGAKWDRQSKQWYVPPGVEVAQFERWPQVERKPVPAAPATSERPLAGAPALAATPVASVAQPVVTPQAAPPRDEQAGRAFRSALQSIAASSTLKGSEVNATLALDKAVDEVHREAWRRTGHASAGDRAIGEMIRTGQGFAAEPLPPQAAVALERIRTEFAVAPAVTDNPAPAQAVGGPAPSVGQPAASPQQSAGAAPGSSWLDDYILTWRQVADRLGLTDRIEAEFAQGKTANEVQRALGEDLGFLEQMERRSFVVAVRASLGIPSRMTAEGQQEFDAWKRDYEIRLSDRNAPDWSSDMPEGMSVDERADIEADIETENGTDLEANIAPLDQTEREHGPNGAVAASGAESHIEVGENAFEVAVPAAALDGEAVSAVSQGVATSAAAANDGQGPTPEHRIGNTPVGGDSVAARALANEPDARNPANEAQRPPAAEPISDVDLARVKSVRDADRAEAISVLDANKAQQHSALEDAAAKRDQQQAAVRVSDADLARVKTVRDADRAEASSVLDANRAQQKDVQDETVATRAQQEAKLKAKPFGQGPAQRQDKAAQQSVTQTTKPDTTPNEIEVGEAQERKPILTATGYEIPKGIEARYVVKEGQFWKPDLKDPNAQTNAAPHIEDKGPRLHSKANDRETLSDMVAIARAKNWDTITVKGSVEFRRNAWLEASLVGGVEVKGFKPTDADRALLEAARRDFERQREALTIRKGAAPDNGATHGATRSEQPSPAPTPAPVPSSPLTAGTTTTAPTSSGPATAAPAAHQPAAKPDASNASAATAHASGTSPAAAQPRETTLTVGQMRTELERSLSGFPVRVREEVLNRFDQRMKVTLDVERRVVRGDLRPDQAGQTVNSQFAAMKASWTAPKPTPRTDGPDQGQRPTQNRTMGA